MSATLLRDGASADLKELADREIELLVERTQDPLDQMRGRQMRILALREAIKVLRERERNPMADR